MTIRTAALACTACALLTLSVPTLARPTAHVTPPTTGGTTGTGGTITGIGGTTTGSGGTTTGNGGSGGGAHSPGCGPGGQRGPGGPGGGAPLVGTITGIDTTNNTITITPSGGTATVVAITSSTALIGHEQIASTAIALGDTLEVSGIPLSIQANTIVDNHLPAPTTTSTSTSTGTSSSSGTAPIPGSLHVRGVVTSLSPPTITVDNNFSVTLTTTSDTTYSEVLMLTEAQLAVGDGVIAQVGKSSSGTLTAIQVDVTPPSS